MSGGGREQESGVRGQRSEMATGRYDLRALVCIALLALLVLLPAVVLSAGKIGVVGPNSVDFGEYPAWHRKTASYRLTNVGQDDLEILKVRKTCGCASASCDRELLRPGETGTVEVVILENSIFDLYSKNIFVESSDPKSRFLKLNVAGNAVPLARVTPQPDVQAGRIAPNATWSRTFRITGPQDLVLGNPATTSNFEVAVNMQHVSEGNYSLTCSLKPTTESGDWRCKIRILVESPLCASGGEQQPHDPVMISVSGRLGQELSVVPGIARLAVSEQTITRSYFLKVLGQQTKILSPGELKLPHRDDVTFKVSPINGGRNLRVNATFSPEFTKALFVDKTIPLEFGVPGAASATVVCKHRE